MQLTNLGLISSRIKPMTLKLVFSQQFPCLTLSNKMTVSRTSRQVYLLCHWERHYGVNAHARFPYLNVVAWPDLPIG